MKIDDPRFISIIPCAPGQEKEVAELIKARFRKTGITEYAMSYPMHPQDDRPLEKVKIQKENFRKIKALLQDTPQIKLGILFQTLLGHGARWTTFSAKSMPGQHIIYPDGTVTHRFCPLEPNFLKYIYEAVKIVAEEHPAFTLGDDDLRIFSGGCFCPLHLAEFQRKTGKLYSRTELSEILDKAPAHAEISRQFEEIQVASMVKLAQTVRRALDTVDPQIQCGTCVVGNRFDFAIPEALALAGPNTKPFLRISNSLYSEGALRDLTWSQKCTGFQVANAKSSRIQLLDESDTCPHNRFSKCAQTMHLHIISGIARGLDGGKLWLDQSVCLWPELSRPYEDILAKNMGLYRVLHQLSKIWQAQGACALVTTLKQEPFIHDATRSSSRGEWGHLVLGGQGIPVFYDFPGRSGIQLLMGDQVPCFNDAELKAILSKPTLIDGTAARELTRRGLASLLGVEAQEREYAANFERFIGDKRRITFTHAQTTPFLTVLPGAKVLSEVCHQDYKGAPVKVVMPGSVYFENSLGGKIVTVAFTPGAWDNMMVNNPGRKLAVLAWLKQLGFEATYLTEFQFANILSAQLPDKSEVEVITNMSYDPLKLHLAMRRVPQQVKLLQGNGKFLPLKFKYEDGILKIDRVLSPAECAILRVEFFQQ